MSNCFGILANSLVHWSRMKYTPKKNYHENCIVALNNVAFVSTVIICLLTEKQDFKVVIIGRLLAWPFGLKITEIPKFIFPPSPSIYNMIDRLGFKNLYRIKIFFVHIGIQSFDETILQLLKLPSCYIHLQLLY